MATKTSKQSIQSKYVSIISDEELNARLWRIVILSSILSHDAGNLGKIIESNYDFHRKNIEARLRLNSIETSCHNMINHFMKNCHDETIDVIFDAGEYIKNIFNNIIRIRPEDRDSFVEKVKEIVENESNISRKKES